MSERDLSDLLAQLGDVMRSKGDALTHLASVRPILEEIISNGLIEERFRKPLPHKPAAYLVHRPPDSAFSVVSMVWGPGMAFPVHDHLAWGLIGVLRGSVSIHALATDLGTKKRNQYDPQAKRVLPFISGYDMPEGCSR